MEKVKAVKTEVYSRVVGYYRPVQDWNRGKQEEFALREYVQMEKEEKEKKD
jgi:anaerobic ribonucleoside-triphosphate reductase